MRPILNLFFIIFEDPYGYFEAGKTFIVFSTAHAHGAVRWESEPSQFPLLPSCFFRSRVSLGFCWWYEGEMIGKPGPFPIVENEGSGNVERPMLAPRRRYSCPHYEVCLNLAAALNWDNFTCRGCCGSVDEVLLWRAHQARRRDKVAGKLCRIPEIMCMQDDDISSRSS